MANFATSADLLQFINGFKVRIPPTFSAANNSQVLTVTNGVLAWAAAGGGSTIFDSTTTIPGTTKMNMYTLTETQFANPTNTASLPRPCIVAIVEN